MLNLGERIKTFRKAANLTQAQFADRLGVHLQTISKWERGLLMPDFSILGEISAVLSVSLEALLSQPEEETFCGSFESTSFGRSLAELRKGRGESQSELSERIGVSTDNISKWERGVTCPDVSALIALSEYFHMPVSRLYYGLSASEPNSDMETPAQTPAQKPARESAQKPAQAPSQTPVQKSARKPAKKPAKKPAARAKKSRRKAFAFYRRMFPRFVYTILPLCIILYIVSALPIVYPIAERSPSSGGVASSGIPERVYLLDYWLCGGSFRDGRIPTAIREGDKVKLSKPEKSGAEFLGWYLSSDYSGEPVKEVACEGRDVRVYAKWSDGACEIRYDLMGGNISGSLRREIRKDETLPLEVPAREGYCFLGWYNAPVGGTRYECVGEEGAKNITLYARWEENALA